MLSLQFAQARKLRSAGNFGAAFALMQSAQMVSDEDAFEAMVCLFMSGNFKDVAQFDGRFRWQSTWAAMSSQALGALARRTDPRAALALARSAVNEPGVPFDAIATYLVLLQINGFIDEAETYIRARLQDVPAGEVFLATTVAEVAVATDDWARAYALALAVLATDLNNLRALAILAIASFELGSTAESLGYATRASQINPQVPMVALQLMRCYNKLGDSYAALAALNRLDDPQAITPEMHAEQGVSYARLGFRQKAIDAFQRALGSPRKPVTAIRGLLRLYADAGERAELQEFVTQNADAINSDIESVYALGLEALSRHEIDRSSALFKQCFALNVAAQAPLHMLPWPVPEPRLRHDREQLALLEHRGRLPASAAVALDTLERCSAGVQGSEDAIAPAQPQEAEALRKALTDVFYCVDPPFSGKTLAENDYAALEESYFKSSPSLIVVDNFLSVEALAALREYCEEATVWRSYNSNGYMGVTLGTGFAPRVLLQAADELRQAMPRVIGQHALTQAWAFKYDQRLRGINMHADFAVVNVNFWITPEDACEDKETGGMVIYDIPAPRHWTFEDYNGDPGKMEAFIKENNAQSRRIPYKENRCVLFDSTLLHTTDRFTFKAGYCNRRVNVTFLYGRTLSTD